MCFRPGPKKPVAALPEIGILRRRWRSHACERLGVIPWHPVCRGVFDARRVPLQFGQIPERVYSVEFAGVNTAHEQIAYHGPVEVL